MLQSLTPTKLLFFIFGLAALIYFSFLGTQASVQFGVGGGEVVLNATPASTGSTLEDGLIGHWTFDGPDVDWSSTTAEIKDVSGGASHGNATTTMSTSNSAKGALGQGMSFNGYTNYLDIPENTTLDNLTEITYSAWLYTATTSGCILCKRTNGGGQEFFGLYNGYPSVCTANGSGCGSEGSSVGNALVEQNAWVHLASTYSDSGDRRSRLFMNGIEVSFVL